MKILFTAFNGKNNSSKILLNNIKNDNINKLYLRNSLITSVKQLENKIKSDDYDLIISFGQAPLPKSTIKIETKGCDTDFYETNYDYSNIKKKLENKKYNVIISNDAGNWFCNNLYYNGLKYIHNEKLKCKMIFIHIPQIDNIDDIKKISNMF